MQTRRLSTIPDSLAIKRINALREQNGKQPYVPGRPIKRTQAKTNTLVILEPTLTAGDYDEVISSMTADPSANRFAMHVPAKKCYCADCKKVFDINLQLNYSFSIYPEFMKNQLLREKNNSGRIKNKVDTLSNITNEISIGDQDIECPECHASSKILITKPKMRNDKLSYTFEIPNIISFSEKTENDHVPASYTRHFINETISIPISYPNEKSSVTSEHIEVSQTIISETTDLRNKNIYAVSQRLPKRFDAKKIKTISEIDAVIKRPVSKTDHDAMLDQSGTGIFLFESSADPFMYPEYLKKREIDGIPNSRISVLSRCNAANKPSDTPVEQATQWARHFRLYNFITNAERNKQIVLFDKDYVDRKSMLVNTSSYSKSRSTANKHTLNVHQQASSIALLRINGKNSDTRSALSSANNSSAECEYATEFFEAERNANILDTEAKKVMLSEYLIANHLLPCCGKNENGEPIYDEFYANWNQNKLLFADYHPLCTEEDSPQSYQKAIATTLMITKYPAAYEYAATLAYEDFKTACMEKGLSEYEKSTNSKRPEKSDPAYIQWVADAKKTFSLDEIMGRPEMLSTKSKIFRDRMDLTMDQLAACDNTIKRSIRASKNLEEMTVRLQYFAFAYQEKTKTGIKDTQTPEYLHTDPVDRYISEHENDPEFAALDETVKKQKALDEVKKILVAKSTPLTKTHANEFKKNMIGMASNVYTLTKIGVTDPNTIEKILTHPKLQISTKSANHDDIKKTRAKNEKFAQTVNRPDIDYIIAGTDLSEDFIPISSMNPSDPKNRKVIAERIKNGAQAGIICPVMAKDEIALLRKIASSHSKDAGASQEYAASLILDRENIDMQIYRDTISAYKQLKKYYPDMSELDKDWTSFDTAISKNTDISIKERLAYYFKMQSSDKTALSKAYHDFAADNIDKETIDQNFIEIKNEKIIDMMINDLSKNQNVNENEIIDKYKHLLVRFENKHPDDPDGMNKTILEAISERKASTEDRPNQSKDNQTPPVLTRNKKPLFRNRRLPELHDEISLIVSKIKSAPIVNSTLLYAPKQKELLEGTYSLGDPEHPEKTLSFHILEDYYSFMKICNDMSNCVISSDYFGKARYGGCIIIGVTDDNGSDTITTKIGDELKQRSVSPHENVLCIELIPSSKRDENGCTTYIAHQIQTWHDLTCSPEYTTAVTSWLNDKHIALGGNDDSDAVCEPIINKDTGDELYKPVAKETTLAYLMKRYSGADYATRVNIIDETNNGAIIPKTHASDYEKKKLLIQEKAKEKYPNGIPEPPADLVSNDIVSRGYTNVEIPSTGFKELQSIILPDGSKTYMPVDESLLPTRPKQGGGGSNGPAEGDNATLEDAANIYLEDFNTNMPF